MCIQICRFGQRASPIIYCGCTIQVCGIPWATLNSFKSLPKHLSTFTNVHIGVWIPRQTSVREYDALRGLWRRNPKWISTLWKSHLLSCIIEQTLTNNLYRYRSSRHCCFLIDIRSPLWHGAKPFVAWTQRQVQWSHENSFLLRVRIRVWRQPNTAYQDQLITYRVWRPIRVIWL